MKTAIRHVRRPPIVAIVLCAIASMAGDNPAKTSLAKAMRAMADGVTMETIDGKTAFARVNEPIYRFDDPARKFSDGTVWAFGKVGRPAALLTFSLEKTPNGDLQWVEEFTSLSSVPIRA